MKDSAEISRQTEAALAHHSEAFGKVDIDDVLSDYTEESMLFTPTASWKTRRPISVAPLGRSGFRLLDDQLHQLAQRRVVAKPHLRAHLQFLEF